MAAGSVAGCGNDEQAASDSSENTTSTVVFTDTEAPTATDSATETPTQEVVFSGGTLADFRAALETASDLPEAVLQIDPGRYRFSPLKDVSAGDKWAHARINGIEDVTIEGNGATFVFTEPLRAGLRFQFGGDVTVRNLTLDYDPVPFTQGETVDLSDDRRQITLRLDDGYPSLEHEMFSHADRVWASAHKPNGDFVEGVRKESSFDKFFSEITPVGDRRFELTLRDGISPNGLEVGGRLTVVARNQGTLLAFYKMDRPTVENVTAHASGGAVFSAYVCSDPVFRDTTIVPPPDSDRQIASDADGIAVVNCLSSATIEGCRHEKLLDDSIVVQHTFTSVTEIHDERTISVEDVHPFVIGPEDTLEALSRSGVRKGSLPAIEDFKARYDTPGDRVKPSTITFAEPITDVLSVGDYIGNRATGSQNFTVRDNELRDHRGILVRIVARNGTIADNVLDGASRNPIELECDNDRHFSPKGWVSDVTVENNQIRRAGMVYFAGEHPAAIRLHLLTRREVPDEGRPHRNITIRENDIETTAGVGINIEDGEGVRVVGNRIANVNQLGYSEVGLSLSNTRDVTIENNEVEGTSGHLQFFGQRFESDGVSTSGNQLRIDSESRPPELRRWLPVVFSFDDALRPGGRYLTTRCYAIRLVSGSEIIQSSNIGVDESGIRLVRGYFDPETADSGTWRWFGGESATTKLAFPAEVLEAADRLEMQAMPIEKGIEGTLSVDGTVTDSVSFDSSRLRWYEFDLAVF